ncbi:unnamed protein product [Orchesella dallaii]|uniref:Thioredoxin domain-containing protein n=1 Tax=Orchesella dallaii TaxID=48710 RepID=A0ABP1Q9G0_9HEXA
MVKMKFTTKRFTFWLCTTFTLFVNSHLCVVQLVPQGENVFNTGNDDSLLSKMASDESKLDNQLTPKELYNGITGSSTEITSLAILLEDKNQTVVTNRKGKKLGKCRNCRVTCAHLRRELQDELRSSVMNMSTGLPFPTVKIVSSEELGNDILLTNMYIKNFSTPGNCTLVIFYASWCQWSAKAAPHLNAIPRAFRNIRFVAVDAYASPSLEMSNYGVYGVPSLLLYHNGRFQARYNGSDITMHSVAQFLMTYTDQRPVRAKMEIKSVDRRGPLRSKHVLVSNKELLVGSWLFIAASLVYYLRKSGILSKLFYKLWFLAQSQMEDEEFKELKIADNNMFHSSLSIFMNM